MVSETSLVEQQCRLREWADQGLPTVLRESVSSNGVSAMVSQKLIIITGSAALGRHTEVL